MIGLQPPPSTLALEINFWMAASLIPLNNSRGLPKFASYGVSLFPRYCLPLQCLRRSLISPGMIPLDAFLAYLRKGVEPFNQISILLVAIVVF